MRHVRAGNHDCGTCDAGFGPDKFLVLTGDHETLQGVTIFERETFANMGELERGLAAVDGVAGITRTEVFDLPAVGGGQRDLHRARAVAGFVRRMDARPEVDVRAGEEVNARIIGSDSFTKTEVRVGINPKVLQQISDLENVKRQGAEELEKLKKDVTTLSVLKSNSGGKLPAEREELLGKLGQQKKKTEDRFTEITMQLEELKAYLGMLQQKGRVCAEQTIFPGVEIYIKDKRFPVRDPYNYIKFSLEGGEIRLSEYEKPEIGEDVTKKMMLRRRR